MRGARAGSGLLGKIIKTRKFSEAKQRGKCLDNPQRENYSKVPQMEIYSDNPGEKYYSDSPEAQNDSDILQRENDSVERNENRETNQTVELLIDFGKD